MKKIAAALLGTVIVVMTLAGCAAATTNSTNASPATAASLPSAPPGTLVPSVTPPAAAGNVTEYPDDLVFTPGGFAYRGNVIQQGQVNPWPQVDTVTEMSGSGNDSFLITYRADIVTNPGQSRNNLVTVSTAAMRDNDEPMTLYANGVSRGFTLTRIERSMRPGVEAEQLVITVGPDVAPDDYTFTFGLVLDGVFRGSYPVTVHVVTRPANTPTVAVTTP